MICLNCRKNQAIQKEPYGYLPCKDCQEINHPNVTKGREFTTEDIKQQRNEYKNDIIQPHRKGELSKEWVTLHGEDAAKQRGFTDREIKRAKSVWSGEISYYKEEK